MKQYLLAAIFVTLVYLFVHSFTPYTDKKIINKKETYETDYNFQRGAGTSGSSSSSYYIRNSSRVLPLLERECECECECDFECECECDCGYN